MRSSFSISATWSTVFSKPSSPKRRSSSFSNFVNIRQSRRRRGTASAVGARWGRSRSWDSRLQSGTIFAGSTKSFALLDRKIPGQEGFDGFRRLAAGRGTTLTVPSQPMAWVDLPKVQRGEDRKEHGGQATTPLGRRAVKILATDCRAPQATFAVIVVHRYPRIVDKTRQSLPVLLQTDQRLAAGRVQLRIGQLPRCLGPHVSDGFTQGRVSWGQRRGIGPSFPSLPVEPVELAD